MILPEGAEDQFATSLPFLEGCDEMQVNPDGYHHRTNRIFIC